MHLYQKTSHYFAQLPDDSKDLALRELHSLGAEELRPVYRGIRFKASHEALYRINLCSRLVHRVLAPLKTFDCHSDKYLYKTALKVKWETLLDPSRTLAVFSSVSDSRIRHSQYAALRLKDAIVDYFRVRHDNKRPSIDTVNPDVWINLHIRNNKATISLDTSGGSLHRRGYRRKTIEAPMMETLAAAILQHTEWDGNTPLYDPFCGSGTILCEALMLAANMPANFLRKIFGFENMSDFDAAVWKKIREQAQSQIKAVPTGRIAGSDKSPQAVQATLRNIGMLDKGNAIQIQQADVFELESLANTTIVTNPPYGVRMTQGRDSSAFYQMLGDFLKQNCKQSTAFIYFGAAEDVKKLGLKPAWKKSLANGGLDGRLAKFEIY